MTIHSDFPPATEQARPQTRRMANSNARNARPANASGGSRSSATNPQNAQRNYERYLDLARNESDRVVAENYLQHAEHYFRSMRETTS